MKGKLLREKTGDVTACAVAHGGLDAVGEGPAIVMGLTVQRNCRHLPFSGVMPEERVDHV